MLSTRVHQSMCMWKYMFIKKLLVIRVFKIDLHTFVYEKYGSLKLTKKEHKDDLVQIVTIIHFTHRSNVS